jgi:hypothetical protein
MGCKCVRSGFEQDNNEIIKTPDQKKRINNIIKANIPLKNKKKESEIISSNCAQQLEEIQYEENMVSQSQYNEKLTEKSSTQINNTSSLIKNEYNEKVFFLINQIRQNPSSYAQIIQSSIKNIKKENDIIIDEITGKEKERTRIIYKKKLKVALYRGEPAFIEAEEILRNTNPLPPLQLNPNIIIPLPQNESQIKDSTYLKNKITEIRKNYNVDIYYKDLIKDPELSVLLMIVDDNYKNAGRKRESILNKDYKYIGISSKFFGKAFIAYFAFSK